MRWRRSVAPLVAAGLLAGCGGGSSTVAPRAYVRAVCLAIGPFEKSLAASAGALDHSNYSSITAEKQATERFLAAAASESDTLLSKLKSAGTPGVADGGKIEQAMVTAFTQLSGAMKRASASARALPTDSATQFKTAADQLGSTVGSSLSGIGSSLDRLSSKELQKLAARESACKALGG